jgi:hypothetical protein
MSLKSGREEASETPLYFCSESGLERGGRRSDERSFQDSDINQYEAELAPIKERQNAMRTLLETYAGAAHPWAAKFNSTTAVLLLLALAVVPRAQATDNGAPEVPAGIAVPEGNKVHLHAYGVGVQIYSWNAATSKWVFVAPEAVLFDSDGNVVGTHFLDVAAAVALPLGQTKTGEQDFSCNT